MEIAIKSERIIRFMSYLVMNIFAVLIIVKAKWRCILFIIWKLIHLTNVLNIILLPHLAIIHTAIHAFIRM